MTKAHVEITQITNINWEVKIIMYHIDSTMEIHKKTAIMFREALRYVLDYTKDADVIGFDVYPLSGKEI